MNSMNIIQRTLWSITLVLAVGGGYAAAQGRTAPTPSAGKPAAQNAGAKKPEMKSCPMHDASAIADVTAENTADGAVIRLKAKKPGDLQRVQEMASMMAKHMTGGDMDCMQHDGMERGGMMHGRDMMHHESGPEPAAQSGNPHKH